MARKQAKTKKTVKKAKRTKRARAIKPKRLTMRRQKRAATMKAMLEYEPLENTRFRCRICGCMYSDTELCCGHETRKIEM